MKKLSIIIVSLLSIVLVACSQKDPVDQAVSILDEATTQIKNAKTEAEAMSITTETSKKLQKLEINKIQLTPEQQKKVTDALIKYMQAAMSSKIDFTGKSGSNVLDMTTPEPENNAPAQEEPASENTAGSN